jgi:hypothetical protein
MLRTHYSSIGISLDDGYEYNFLVRSKFKAVKIFNTASASQLWEADTSALATSRLSLIYYSSHSIRSVQEGDL